MLVKATQLPFGFASFRCAARAESDQADHGSAHSLPSSASASEPVSPQCQMSDHGAADTAVTAPAAAPPAAPPPPSLSQLPSSLVVERILRARTLGEQTQFR